MQWIGRALAVLLVLVLLSWAGLWWITGTDSGTQWALARVQGTLGAQLQIDATRGNLTDGLDIERLLYESDGMRVEAVEVHLRAQALRALLGQLLINEARAGRVDVLLKPSADNEPPSLPQSLALPIGVRVEDARIDELFVTQQENDVTQRIAALHARYQGGPGGHTLEDFGATTAYGALTATGRIAGRNPFPLDAAIHYTRNGAALPNVREDLPLAARVDLSGSLENLQAALSADADKATLKAQLALAPLAERWLTKMNIEAHAIDLRRLNEAWPQTQLSLDAQGAPTAAQPLAGTLTIINTTPGAVDQEKIPLARIETHFETDFARAHLSELRIDLGKGGSLTGQAETGPAQTALNLEAHALNLRALYSTLRETALAGPLDIRLTERQQYLKGTLKQNDFGISADAMREGNRVDVRTLQASASGGEVSGNGHVELDGAMPFAADLRLRRFDPAQFGDYPRGHVNGSIEVKGQLAERSRLVHAQWIIDDSRLSDQPLASRGRARIEAQRVSEVEALARWGAANMNADGAFGRRGDVLRWRLEAPQLAKLDKRLNGSVKSNGTLTGVWADPRAAFELSATALHLPGDIAIGALKGSGVAGTTPKSPLQLDLVATRLAAGDIRVARAAADIDGSVAQHTATLDIAAQDVDLNARLAGGWTAAQGWVGTIEDLRNRGRFPLDLVRPAPLRIAPQRVALGRLEAKFADGGIVIREATWANRRLQTSGEFTRLPAAWLIVAAGLRDQLRSTLLLDAKWSIAADPQLNGTLSLARAAGDVTLLSAPAIALDLEQLSVQAKFVNDDVRAMLDLRSAIADAAINARLQPVVTASGSQLTVDSPLTLDAKVNVASLRPFSVLFDTTGRIDGRLQADLRGSGTLKAPNLHGSINGDNLAFDVPPYGMYLEKGRLRAQLEGEVLNVQEFVLHGGNGRFLMSGRVPLRMADGGTDLSWRAERFAAMNRPDMRLVVTGDGTVRFVDKKIALVGQLQANRGYFEVGDNQLPELSDDVVIVGAQRKVAQKQADAPFPIQLDLRLNLGDDLRLFAYGYQGYLGGRLRLYTNPEGMLRAEGRINTDRGRFTAYGKRLDVEKGVITFDGPVDNPTLQVEAWQRNQAVEVGVKLSGTVESPHVQLVSEPPVSDGEKLSWLVLGRPPGDAQGADLALLQAAAGTMFGRGDAVGINQRLAQQLGLDDLSFRGSGELTGNVVALGKRFSDKVYVTFEQGIGLAQSLVKLDYSLSRRWSARLETGSVSGIGLVYRIAFD